MAKFVVAIDGGAGSGKSTTARELARRLNFFYLDTGAMYRAITLKYLQRDGDKNNIDTGLVSEIIASTTIDLRLENSMTRVYLDEKDVTLEIRKPQVNDFVSQISAIPAVRKWMVEKQREVAKGKEVVCEGRDIGTVVFPNAQVKIFMQADLEVRAQRRRKELSEKNIESNFNEVRKNLKFRDNYDSSRQHSPLKKAEDAIVVDTTKLTIEQEISFVEKIVRERMTRHNCAP
jgi:cytidylate kinase